MADTQRKIIGGNNRANGQLFENLLDVSCEYYYEKGIACIEKTPEPMKVIKPFGDRRFGQYIACYKKTAQPDYKGSLCDGTCIIFDAKHTDTDRITQAAVTDNQVKVFDRYQSMKAKCYLIVSLGFEDFYRVPWNVWKNMKQLYGHKHMTRQELEQYRIKGNCSRVLFLEGVTLYEDR